MIPSSKEETIVLSEFHAFRSGLIFQPFWQEARALCSRLRGRIRGRSVGADGLHEQTVLLVQEAFVEKQSFVFLTVPGGQRVTGCRRCREWVLYSAAVGILARQCSGMLHTTHLVPASPLLHSIAE